MDGLSVLIFEVGVDIGVGVEDVVGVGDVVGNVSVSLCNVPLSVCSRHVSKSIGSTTSCLQRRQ